MAEGSSGFFDSLKKAIRIGTAGAVVATGAAGGAVAINALTTPDNRTPEQVEAAIENSDWNKQMVAELQGQKPLQPGEYRIERARVVAPDGAPGIKVRATNTDKIPPGLGVNSIHDTPIVANLIPDTEILGGIVTQGTLDNQGNPIKRDFIVWLPKNVNGYTWNKDNLKQQVHLNPNAAFTTSMDYIQPLTPATSQSPQPQAK